MKIIPKKDSKEEEDILCDVRTSAALEFRNNGRLSDTHRKAVKVIPVGSPFYSVFPHFEHLFSDRDFLDLVIPSLFGV